MLTTTLILGIIDKLLGLLVIAAQKSTPEQFQALLERHERRMDLFEGLLDRFKGEA